MKLICLDKIIKVHFDYNNVKIKNGIVINIKNVTALVCDKKS